MLKILIVYQVVNHRQNYTKYSWCGNWRLQYRLDHCNLLSSNKNMSTTKKCHIRDIASIMCYILSQLLILPNINTSCIEDFGSLVSRMLVHMYRGF